MPYETEEEVDLTIPMNKVIEEKNPDDELMKHYDDNLDESDDDEI